MKPLSLKANRRFLFKSSFTVIASLIFLLVSSYSKTEACEEDNTRTLIIENSRSTGVLKIFFNHEPGSAMSLEVNASSAMKHFPKELLTLPLVRI